MSRSVSLPQLSMPISPSRPALFPSAFHPSQGGVEELTRQLALEQMRRGVEPVVVTMRWPHALPTIDAVDGIPIRRFVFHVPRRRPRPLLEWALKSPAVSRQVLEAVRAHHADVVHVQCVSGNARYALRSALRLQLPLVVSLQGELTMDSQHIYQRSWQMRAAWRQLIASADVVTACAKYVLDEAQDFYGVPFEDRGVVIRNGVDFGECRRAVPEVRARPYVLGLGRLVPEKGYDLLIDAFAILASEHPHLDLVIAGGGEAREELERQARDRGLGARVDFLGAVSHERALSLFAGAKVFVLASRHEPQGIVVLEAMATCTPVVAARVGGVPELVVDGKNGFLFSGSDVRSLAAVLSSALAADPEHVVGRGLETAQQHSWSRQADQYMRTYERAFELSRGRRGNQRKAMETGHRRPSQECG